LTHILVTNDDGVFAPSLMPLVRAVSGFGKVTILAPDRNWSGSGHVKTLTRPLRIKTVNLDDGLEAISCDGAPSDCVALALLGYIREEIDLVVSGINPTANLGSDLTYSGTVTAAMEAAIFHKPGIAFSFDNLDSAEKDHTSTAEEVCREVTSQVIQHGLPKGVLLNVNIPNRSIEEIQGFQITRQGQRIYRDLLDSRIDPMGRPYYWIGGELPTGIPDNGTDFGALSRGFVSITPVHLDMTAYQWMETLQAWQWQNQSGSTQGT